MTGLHGKTDDVIDFFARRSRCNEPDLTSGQILFSNTGCQHRMRKQNSFK